MVSYDFRTDRHGNAVYGPSRVLKGISLFFIILLFSGLISVIREESFTLSSLVPVLIMFLLMLTLTYRDSWKFSNKEQKVTYIWGFGPFVKKLELSYDDISRIEVTHFTKGIPSTSANQEPSWKHRAQVVLAIRIDEDTKHDLEIMDEKRSGGKLERNASWLSGFTGISLFVDRPRNTKSYGGVEEIFFKRRK